MLESVETNTDESKVTVGETRKGQEITVKPTNLGWVIKLEGGGAQPFAGELFTNYARAVVAVEAWKLEQARSVDAYKHKCTPVEQL